MDIKELLNDPDTILTYDELEMLEAELSTGNYDKEYVEECMEIIREWKALILHRYSYKDESYDPALDYKAKSTILIPKQNLMNNKQKNVSVSADEKFKNIIGLYRENQNPNRFDYLVEALKAENMLNEEFLSKNAKYLTSEEIRTIVDNLQFSEEFLEENFYLIGGDAIATRQLFSEGFYMKHFDDMPFGFVEQGKNEWIKKDKRSQKLTLFLRLKGIEK